MTRGGQGGGEGIVADVTSRPFEKRFHVWTTILVTTPVDMIFGKFGEPKCDNLPHLMILESKPCAFAVASGSFSFPTLKLKPSITN